jgi:hypothetical protein
MDGARENLGRCDDDAIVGEELPPRSLSDDVQARLDNTIEIEDDLPFPLGQPNPPRVVVDLSESSDDEEELPGPPNSPASVCSEAGTQEYTAPCTPPRLRSSLSLLVSHFPPSPMLEALASPTTSNYSSQASTQPPLSPPFRASAGHTPPPTSLRCSNNFVPVMKEAVDAYVLKYGGNPIMFLCSFWNAPNKWHFESIVPDDHKNDYFIKNDTTRTKMYSDAKIDFQPVLPHCNHCKEVFETDEEGHFENRYCPCIDYHKICGFCVADEVHDPVKCDDCGDYATRKRGRSHPFFGFASGSKKQRTI